MFSLRVHLLSHFLLIEISPISGTMPVCEMIATVILKCQKTIFFSPFLGLLIVSNFWICFFLPSESLSFQLQGSGRYGIEETDIGAGIIILFRWYKNSFCMIGLFGENFE